MRLMWLNAPNPIMHKLYPNILNRLVEIVGGFNENYKLFEHKSKNVNVSDTNIMKNFFLTFSNRF